MSNQVHFTGAGWTPRPLASPSIGGPSIAGPSIGGWAAATLRKILPFVLTWANRARERNELARVDDRMLLDMGLTRADMRREIDKPFWRA